MSMETEIKITEAKPVAQVSSGAFVEYASGAGGFVFEARNIYAGTPEGCAFRKMRHSYGVSLGDIVRTPGLVGVTVSMISDLETGRMLTDAAGWETLGQIVAKAKAKKGSAT